MICLRTYARVSCCLAIGAIGCGTHEAGFSLEPSHVQFSATAGDITLPPSIVVRAQSASADIEALSVGFIAGEPPPTWLTFQAQTDEEGLDVILEVQRLPVPGSHDTQLRVIAYSRNGRILSYLDFPVAIEIEP